jgi:hypothetical protein
MPLEPQHQRIVCELLATSVSHCKREGGLARACPPAERKQSCRANYRPGMERLPPHGLQDDWSNHAECFNYCLVPDTRLRPNPHFRRLGRKHEHPKARTVNPAPIAVRKRPYANLAVVVKPLDDFPGRPRRWRLAIREG